MNEKILSINELLEYLKVLKELDECLIIFSIKDTAGTWLKEDIQEKLYSLGLKENLVNQWMVGYAAVVDRGKLLFEEKSRQNGTVETSISVEEMKIDILSKPFNSGNVASVVINGKEYAMNRRGLNIVVWNLNEKKLVDSICFDTHIEKYPYTRKVNLKKKYDIALVGFWYGCNYGSLLNGYAIYNIFKSLGKNVLMVQKPKVMENDPEITTGHNTNFVKKYYDSEDISPSLPYEQLSELNDWCDCFCAGSDQIWNHNLSFRENFYLPFVEAGKKLISVATSFGHAEDRTPLERRKFVQTYLERYHAISVREQFDLDILKNNYGLRGNLVFEPVFCIDKNIYTELARESKFDETSPYLLAYILDPTLEKREAISYYQKQLGIKVIVIVDGDLKKLKRNSEILHSFEILSNVGAEDFIKVFMNAQYVITDSFHGSAFSIIFRKSFLAIGNYGRGYERFIDLLGRLKLLDRLVIDPQKIPHDAKYLKPLDYSVTDKIIEKESKKTIEWIKYVLETKIEDLPSIKLPDKEVTTKIKKGECTGCGACVSICPTEALELRQDELGYYRAYINYEKCINCGKCSTICPVLNNPESKNEVRPKCYELIAANDDLLYKSSSGGVFSLLARGVLEEGGLVVGAAWKEDFSVEHIIISNETELYKLQKSKYLQSYMGNIFKRIKEYLKEGRKILFTGCPCQVSGLKSYLEKEYDNLITVDLLCGNSPSTMFFQKYISEAFPEGVKKYEFRHKEQGWNWDCVTVTVTDGTKYVIRGAREDDYQRAYHNHLMCPPHCENCKFQKLPRYGDITIGDFWWINDKDKSLNVKKGVSAVLCNNKKGQEVLEHIPIETIGVKKEVPMEWLRGNGFVPTGHNWAAPQRNEFYNAIQVMEFSQAVNYALKPNKGMYDKEFLDSNMPLQYGTDFLHFSYDKNVWEEHFINGETVLIVKSGQSKVGRYAKLPLCKALKKGQRYSLFLKYRINTISDVMNFHIKDSGSNLWQIIYSHKLSEKDRDGSITHQIMVEFTPMSNIFDEFMIGAAQVRGNNNYIAFERIVIQELMM